MNKKFSLASFFVALAMVFAISPSAAFALDNGVYTCHITTHYAHPQTGVIEDSGGEGSKVTGQKMTEGAIAPEGLFEQTSDGSFVTIRFVLIDAVSDVNFFIDNKAVSHEIVNKGTNDKGNGYADLRLKVPSDSAVIKCKMYVEPMDRNVVFFMTMSDFVPGNGDFKATASNSSSSSSNGLADEVSNALSKIEQLKNIDTSQRDLFVASIKSAKSKADIEKVLENAQKADETAELENALGEAKSAAYKKIDEMNLSPDEAKALKQQIKDAKTVAEVDAVLSGNHSEVLSMPFIVLLICVATAVVVFIPVLKKKKSDESKAQKSEDTSSNQDK